MLTSYQIEIINQRFKVFPELEDYVLKHYGLSFIDTVSAGQFDVFIQQLNDEQSRIFEKRVKGKRKI